MDHQTLIACHIGFASLLSGCVIFVTQKFIRGYRQRLLPVKGPLPAKRRRPDRSKAPVPASKSDPIRTAVLFKDGATVPVALKHFDGHGAFIVCNSPLRLSDTFELTVDLPDRERLRFAGVVIWSNAGMPAHKVVVRGMRARLVPADTVTAADPTTVPAAGTDDFRQHGADDLPAAFTIGPHGPGRDPRLQGRRRSGAGLRPWPVPATGTAR